MATHLFKIWYKRNATGETQLDLFESKHDWIGPMFMSGEDSEDAIQYLAKTRSDLTIKCTGKWRKRGDRFY